MVEALKAHIEGLAAHIERWERVAKIVSEVESELSRALDKFPAAFHSGHEGYAVIREELDELWDAVKADDEAHACREAVQVAAMVGPGAAGTAYIPGLADFVPMVKDVGSLALGGPALTDAELDAIDRLDRVRGVGVLQSMQGRTANRCPCWLRARCQPCARDGCRSTSPTVYAVTPAYQPCLCTHHHERAAHTSTEPLRRR